MTNPRFFLIEEQVLYEKEKAYTLITEDTVQ